MPKFSEVICSLADLVGEAYLEAVCEARACLSGEDINVLKALASSPVSFFPPVYQSRLIELLPLVGTRIMTHSFAGTCRGAGSKQFHSVSKTATAPLNGYGYYRVGEDGCLYLTTKSEHYHLSLGHSFPGYQLLEYARRLGIPNATHNNTRGQLTRLLEEEIIRVVNGIDGIDRKALQKVLDSDDPQYVNRVINLETGSLAAEAALKMVLARFYRIQNESPCPKYQGRVPVILVIGNDKGGLHGNYHGTTLLTQAMRGMWPEMLEAMEKHDIFYVRAIRPNSVEDLVSVFQQYERSPYKIAGFFHEIVMMNFGGRLLSRDFLQRAYDLCSDHDVPTVDDEIQSCLWSPDMLLFREYGLNPSIIAVGKGFPGGEYPASRVLFNSEMDSLPLFGALVTNGQEEIASLAYMVTMRWAQANAAVTRDIGNYYEERLRELASRHHASIVEITGKRHLAGIAFHELEIAGQFAGELNRRGLDISVQSYKSDCPSVALTKLPLIAGREVVDFIINQMNESLR